MDGFDHTSGIVVIASTNRADILDPAIVHVVLVHEDDGAQAFQAAVSVVVGIDGRVELVVRPDRGQRQPSTARIDVVRQYVRLLQSLVLFAENELASAEP